jgi:putative cardiolipin synthase
MQKPIEGKELGLHAKLLLIDDDLTFIGSANLDARSLRLNTEMGLLIRSEPLNRLVRESITMDFEEGNAWRLLQDEDGGIIWVSGETILRSQPSASTFRRIEDWFFSILPIEGEM